MSYEDFICFTKYYFLTLTFPIGFMLSEEDKTTVRSLEYWFKLVDLDNNGIITYVL